MRVRRGGTLVVLDRNTPIARVVPYDHGETARGAAAASDRIAELARDGVVSPGDPQGLSRWLDDHPPIKRPKGAPSAVQALLDMRRESTR